MATTLETLQTAHTQLGRTFREKRLRLSDREQTLARAVDEKAVVMQTLDTILQDRAREAHALQQLADSVVALEADLTHSRTEYRTLSRAHEDLVATYHTCFLESQAMARDLSATKR